MKRRSFFGKIGAACLSLFVPINIELKNKRQKEISSHKLFDKPDDIGMDYYINTIRDRHKRKHIKLRGGGFSPGRFVGNYQ